MEFTTVNPTASSPLATVHPSYNKRAACRRWIVLGAVATVTLVIAVSVGVTALRPSAANSGSRIAGAPDFQATSVPGATTSAPVAGTSAPATDTSAPPAARVMVHPGVLHSADELNQMMVKVAQKAEPWYSGFQQLAPWVPLTVPKHANPQVTIQRGIAGPTENFGIMYADMLTAYDYALQWKATNNSAYAEYAVYILDRWAAVNVNLTGNSNVVLAAGLYGYQWANTAELLRTYSGWPATSVKVFQDYLVRVFVFIVEGFLKNQSGPGWSLTHYWPNWDLCAMASVAAIGIFADRPDIYEKAITYYKTGSGNGAIAHAVYRWHPGNIGQFSESVRDQGHSTLSAASLGSFLKMAWNQGDDLYSYDNNRALAAFEYIAASNVLLPNGSFPVLPFSLYVIQEGTFYNISQGTQPLYRNGWESVYNHYVNRLGMDAPWVTALAAKMRPENLDWRGDEPSFATLSQSLDPITFSRPPSGLTAYMVDGKVELSWWGSLNATTYQPQRSASPAGPFTTLSTINANETRTYTDSPPTNGTWYYRIVATFGNKPSLIGEDVRSILLPNQLRMHLPLNDGQGTIARDVSGFGLDGELMFNAKWGPGRHNGSSLWLNGTNGYLAMPPSLMRDLSDYTVSWWAKCVSYSVPNTYMLSIGTGTVSYMMLNPSVAGSLHYLVTLTEHYGERPLATNSFPVNQWTHIAITLAGTNCTLYINGAARASQRLDLAPFQFGNTTNNWLGRSQYPADAYFNGFLQDFRIYSGALPPRDIMTLATLSS